MEAEEVGMVREGCRATRVWRVSELRRMGGADCRAEGGSAARRGTGEAGE